MEIVGKRWGEVNNTKALDSDPDNTKDLGSSEKPVVAISMCACGIPCRYHGLTHKMGRRLYKEKKVAKLREKYELLPICPEIMGGLPTPRPACFTTWDDNGNPIVEVRGLKNGKREFRTEEYIRGSNWVLWLCREFGVKVAYLMKDSPACDADNGVCGRLLRTNNIIVRKL